MNLLLNMIFDALASRAFLRVAEVAFFASSAFIVLPRIGTLDLYPFFCPLTKRADCAPMDYSPLFSPLIKVGLLFIILILCMVLNQRMRRMRRSRPR